MDNLEKVVSASLKAGALAIVVVFFLYCCVYKSVIESAVPKFATTVPKIWGAVLISFARVSMGF